MAPTPAPAPAPAPKKSRAKKVVEAPAAQEPPAGAPAAAAPAATPAAKAKRAPSAYNKFAAEHMKAGRSMKEVSELWKAEKAKQQ